jgi:hypothetical protein
MAKTEKKKRKHQIIRYLEYNILHIQDTPHSIALGVAFGLFIAPNPLLGLHIVIILLLCILFRANKFSAIISTTVSNFLTIIPILYADYVVGYRLYDIFNSKQALSKSEIIDLFKKTFTQDNTLSAFWNGEYWCRFVGLFKAVGPELCLGSLLLGFFAAAAGYVVCYILIKNHRTNSPHRRHRIIS